MSRYRKYNILYNSSDYYSFLRKNRDVKGISQFETPILQQPSINERTQLISTQHIWKYGDRYYKLAQRFYGKPEYWWVIAWYNGMPTESVVKPGDLISIPLDLSDTLSVLGLG